MGYSERYCHICGVSFNMGRIRTKTEPRSDAWHVGRNLDNSYPSFVNAGRNSHIGECGRDAGCMLAYREDMAIEVENRQRERRRARGNDDHETKDDDENDDDGDDDENDDDGDDDDDDENFSPDELIMQKLCVDDDFKTVHSPSMLQTLTGVVQNLLGGTEKESQDNTASGQNVNTNDVILSEESGTDSSMDYEYETPPDTCSEYSDKIEDIRMEMSSDYADEEEIRYQDFRKSLQQQTRSKPAQASMTELMLPLFRPIEGKEEDSLSTHGSDASFECDEAEGSHERNSLHLDHWLSGKLSHYGHAFSKNMPRYARDCVWEHIAGPGCLNAHGYHGTRITEEEMRFTNTLQCLVQKGDAGREGYGDEAPSTPNWQTEWDDEPWEGEAAWFLSGISDFMPSRDMSDPDVFPERHGRKSINAENVCWGPDVNNSDPRYAMPFHPACLEIYRRVAIEKHGLFNVDLLGTWWRLKSRYGEFNSFPRSAAAQRGVEQEWKHNPGDEHLAADPLFPPGLVGAISSAKIGKSWTPNCPMTGIWASLPAEIVNHILGYLNAVEVAKVSLAIPMLRPTAKQIIQTCLKEQYPVLWELDAAEPYSKWTGLTAWQLKIMQKALDEKESEHQSVTQVLEDEGCNEALDHVKQQWEQDSDARKKAAFGAVLQGRPSLQIPIDGVGIARFAIALEEASTNDDLKGLQNRQRIWKDCETILDQIEQLQRDGEILANGQPRPGAKLYEHDQ